MELIVPIIVVWLPIIVALVLKFAFNVGAKPVSMRNPGTGMTKNGYYGYSWTYLFFGFFVPLFRSKLGVAALHFLFGLITFGLWNLIVSFLYNHQHAERLLQAGFKMNDTAETEAAASAKWGVDLKVHKVATA